MVRLPGADLQEACPRAAKRSSTQAHWRTVISGSSSQLVLKESTDDLGIWTLEKNEVVIKINRDRYVLNLVLSESDNAIIDFASHGITVKSGDQVEISKLKLYCDSKGTHSLNAILLDNGLEISSNTISFKL